VEGVRRPPAACQREPRDSPRARHGRRDSRARRGCFLPKDQGRAAGTQRIGDTPVSADETQAATVQKERKRKSEGPSLKVAHPTPDQRTARGKATRTAVPRASHGDWEPSPDRPDPVALLEDQAHSRVPELVPIRYGRMLVSPFTFYRGGAYLMAADLAGTPKTGLTTQLCGDAHL